MRCSICRRRFARPAGCPEHGAAAALRDAPDRPELAGIALGALLGHGGFSSVWAGELEA